MGENIWAYIFGAGGGVTLLGMVVKTVADFLTGRAANERVRNTDLMQQLETAWDERDRAQKYAEEQRDRADAAAKLAREADASRRRLAEALSEQRARCLERHGSTTADLVPWPR